MRSATRTFIVSSLLASAPADAQAPAVPPAFEVASVKPQAQGEYHTPLSISGNRITVVAPPRSLILMAYELPSYQISGGAAWINTDAFEIVAKAEGQEPLTMERARPMLQTLLADRFHLKVHREMRETAVYALVPAKNGTKLKESTSSANPSIIGGGSKGLTQLTVTKSLLSTFAQAISGMAGRPVLDKTGLTGSYDFKIAWAQNQNTAPATDAASDLVGPSLFTAVEEELGLKLEPTKAPLEMLIIESAEKPSEN